MRIWQANRAPTQWPLRGLIRYSDFVTLTSMNEEEQESLRGVVERITYHNEESGYTVAKLALERPTPHLPHWQREAPIVGAMVGVNVGEAVELGGAWEVHPQYGKQFTVKTLRSVLPATVAGMEKYLGSGLVKGVGPVTAKRVVAHFGTETLDIIDENPERLSEVKGVGRKRVAMINAAWAEQSAIREVMIFLQSHGVSAGLATKIYKRYGNLAVETVQRNPYRLSEDIYGIGFLTADKIARDLGIAADAPQRVAAAVEFALNGAADEGHVYLPGPELIRQADALVHVGREKTATALLRLKAADRVKLAAEPGAEAEALHWAVTGVFAQAQNAPPPLFDEGRDAFDRPTDEQIQALLQEERAVYLAPLYYAELGVSNRLLRQIAPGPGRLQPFQGLDWERKFSQLERNAAHEQLPVRLVSRQRAAVRSALTHRLTVLTGGPGTGKTTVVRTIIEMCEGAGAKAILAAPTGRAAKRLSETTGRQAKTIHRLLEFQPSAGFSFKRNDANPLSGDLLIVDEASMLDLVLTNHLLKAIPPAMSLLLVGDVDQLPSVGPGNVLKDIIAAITGARDSNPDWSRATVVRLETIFRQAAGSYIVKNAHGINRGEMPFFAQKAPAETPTAEDFFLFSTEEPERAAQLCVELVQERIPRRFGIPPQEIQVLSPMHRGAAGVASLNYALQQALNPARPDSAERSLGSRFFRAGDRVMQVRNNYDKDVYNGDMGYITAIDLIEQRVLVEIDNRAVAYDFLELDELAHAYAISVHKSQGSEFPAVVIPVLTSHYMMLQRNLLYTAVTRAKRLVVLVGQPKAISIAIGNNNVAHRFSGLTERLKGAAAKENFQ